MKTKIVQLLLCLAAVVTVQAQEKGLKFQSLVQGGLLEGEQGSALQLQTINGINFKTWSAGVGVGLDYYHTRSIPLFLDVRKAFSTQKKTAFLFASGGYNFPWLRKEDKLWMVSNSKGGMYYEAGIGYQVPVLKASALFFSAGYSVKEFSTTSQNGFVIAIYPSPAPYYFQNNYNLQRISIKTGLRF